MKTNIETRIRLMLDAVFFSQYFSSCRSKINPDNCEIYDMRTDEKVYIIIIMLYKCTVSDMI